MIERFLLGRLQTLGDLSANQVAPIARLMTRGLARNPRKVKRAFNSLRLTLALSKAHGAQAYPVQLAKLAIIQTSYFKVYEEIACIPRQLRALEDATREIGSPEEAKKALVKERPRLRDTLFDPPFFRDLDETQLQRLIYLTSSGKPGDGM